MMKKMKLYQNRIIKIIMIFVLSIFLIFTFLPISKFEIIDEGSGEVIISTYILLVDVLKFHILPFIIFYLTNLNFIIFSFSKYNVLFDERKYFIFLVVVIFISFLLFIFSIYLATNSNLVKNI